MNLAKLACTATLLFVTIVGACCFGDCLTIRYSWLVKHDRKLIIVLDTPFESAEMELSLAGKYGLLELLGLLDHPSRILLVHTGKNGHEFLGITFGDRAYGAAVFGFGETDEIKLPFTILGIESVAGTDIL